mgnify:CR=1 FL=1
MMTIPQLLTHLYAAGITVTLNEGRLQVHPPEGTLTQEIRMLLRNRRNEMLTYLLAMTNVPRGPCQLCSLVLLSLRQSCSQLRQCHRLLITILDGADHPFSLGPRQLCLLVLLSLC